MAHRNKIFHHLFKFIKRNHCVKVEDEHGTGRKVSN